MDVIDEKVRTLFLLGKQIIEDMDIHQQTFSLMTRLFHNEESHCYSFF